MTNPASDPAVERVIRRVRAALLDIEAHYKARGRSVAELDIDKLALRMAAVVPLPSPVNDQIGPFYSSEQVARLLDISRQAVNERVKRCAILALRTVDGVWVYPTFQFDGRQLLAGLTDVLAELRQQPVDRWAVAAWLVSPTAALDGTSPLEAIQAGGNIEAVRQLARDALRRWTQ